MIAKRLFSFCFAGPLDESMYSTVDQRDRLNDQTARQKRDQYCRAAFDYEAQGNQELSFKAGDLIKVHFKETEEWWCGEFRGKKGMIPVAFVEKVTL